ESPRNRAPTTDHSLPSIMRNGLCDLFPFLNFLVDSSLLGEPDLHNQGNLGLHCEIPQRKPSNTEETLKNQSVDRETVAETGSRNRQKPGHPGFFFIWPPPRLPRWKPGS